MVDEKFQKSVPNFSLIKPKDVVLSKMKLSFQLLLANTKHVKVQKNNIIVFLQFTNIFKRKRSLVEV